MKFILLIAAMLFAAQTTETLTRAERDKAVAELQESKKAFLESSAGLTDAQWNFKPGPDRWSVAECVEHVALSQDLIYGVVTGNLVKSPADPAKRAAVKGKDEAVLTMTPDRSHKFKAPEALLPTKKLGTPAETLKHYDLAHDQMVEYVETTQDDLRDHFQEHPAFGPLDGYQWILLVSAHTRRHTAQILELKAAPNFPKM